MRIFAFGSISLAASVVVALPLVLAGPAAVAALLPGGERVAPPITCDGAVATIVGGADDRVVRGTEGDDVIAAGPGDNRVLAGAGEDLVCGGDGYDEILTGAGDDVVWGGNDGRRSDGGSDVIVPGPGDDEVHGGVAPDEEPGRQRDEDLVFVESRAGAVAELPGGGTQGTVMVSRQETDTLDGIHGIGISGGGPDRVRAGADTVLVETGAGDDLISVPGSDALVVAGAGDDRVRGGGNVELNSGDDRSVGARQRALGQNGADVLVGRRNAGDRLFGSAGRDLLRGLGGDDLLVGDGGVDRLRGGAGRDECRSGESVRGCEA